MHELVQKLIVGSTVYVNKVDDCYCSIDADDESFGLHDLFLLLGDLNVPCSASGVVCGGRGHVVATVAHGNVRWVIAVVKTKGLIAVHKVQFLHAKVELSIVTVTSNK